MDQNKDKTELIIHGHFYQPQRENPLTGLVGQHFSSSGPFLNWNEKIFHDCYSANANSRYLSETGRIMSITNNFNWISNDFGPALLRWIKKFHPGTYEAIISSDRKSSERLGHGGALATTFNHTILPLDDRKRQALQIEWGITDFQKRYGRDPEGFWLPDSAVNSDIIDMLADQGIKFIILPGTVAKGIEDTDGTFYNIAGLQAPSSEAFIVEGTKGRRISAFFADRELSNGVSFRHYLRSADELYERLLKTRETNGHKLIQCVTAGEIYGHFEPYGDMALSAMIRKVGEREDFKLTNYAAYLEGHPAERLVHLNYETAPDGNKWTSLHGVMRWYTDPNEGIRSSKWMVGLRKGLDNLWTRMDEIYQKEVKKILGDGCDPYSLMSRAKETMTGFRPMTEFMKDLHKEYRFDEKSDSRLATLITGIKMMNLAYTSGGFFYEDKAGLEAKQCLRYALCAIKNYQDFIDGDLLLPFLADVRKAKSPIEPYKTAMDIALDLLKDLKGEDEAAVALYLSKKLAPADRQTDRYGCYQMLKKSDTAPGRVERIFDTETLKVYRFSILSSSSMDNGINLYISKETENKNDGPTHLRIQTEDIPKRLMSRCFEWIDQSMNSTAYNEVREMIKSLFHYSILVNNTGMEEEKARDTNENIGVALKIIKSTLTLSTEGLLEPDIKHQMGILLEFITKQGRKEDIESLKNTMDQYMDILADKIWRNGLTDDFTAHILSALLMTRKNGIEPQTTKLQNEIYHYYTGEKKSNVRADKLAMLYDALNFQ